MASQVASITHYEIYVLAKRRWTLQVRFRQDQKDEALEEARTIERTLGLPVKVMRETYFPGRNLCEEAAVYISPRAAVPEPAPGRGVEAAAHGWTGGGRGGAPETRSVFDGESTGTLVLMLLVIVVVALAIAATANEALNMVLAEARRAGSMVSEDTRSKLAFGTFAITFLGVAIPMSLWFIAGAERRARERAKRAKARSRAAASRPPLFSREERALGRAVRGMLWDMLAAPFRPPEPRPAAAPAPAAAEPPPPVPAPLPVPEPEAEAPPAPPADPEPAAEQAAAEPAPPAAEAVEKHRLTAMRFLGETVTQLKRTNPQLDAYSRFGVNLVLAGALDRLARQAAMDEAARLQVLREAIGMLGTKPALAETFCEKQEEYLLEPRYLQMVETGRDCMEAFLAGEAAPLKKLDGALEAWNRPGARQQAQRIVTVLFTDIVGSTDLTQTQGDVAVQGLVRRHNAIVRNALSEFDGREIKHTGDGIMASFASTANAVDAAIAVQRAVAGYGASPGNLPLRLRIGINAGEPIEEEDDLFGTTVQLAARLCAKAEPEQILCSNVVRELSAGKGRRFDAKGAQALKGFPDPVPLFEVAWRETAPAGVT